MIAARRRRLVNTRLKRKEKRTVAISSAPSLIRLISQPLTSPTLATSFRLRTCTTAMGDMILSLSMCSRSTSRSAWCAVRSAGVDVRNRSTSGYRCGLSGPYLRSAEMTCAEGDASEKPETDVLPELCASIQNRSTSSYMPIFSHKRISPGVYWWLEQRTNACVRSYGRCVDWRSRRALSCSQDVCGSPSVSSSR